MGWSIFLTKQVLNWVGSLDDVMFDHYEAARQELEARGPGLGRPWVDSLRASRQSNMKELRIPGANAHRRTGLMELYETSQSVHPRGGYDKSRVAAVRKKMRSVERAYRLAELREAQQLNQTELGNKIGIGQRTVSKIEHGEIERSRIETIRKYVEALGGEIQVVARFGDEAYTIA
ncbi:helix-turn-helix domain-containing protein [Nocardia sp. NPDC058176]|uniref:helix-turn-helix domain-containing protein n=1 Tax=Nocardia sp. NPDC058176 TaxID=3346368 RepID=UPI0036DCF4E4